MLTNVVINRLAVKATLSREPVYVTDDHILDAQVIVLYKAMAAVVDFRDRILSADAFEEVPQALRDLFVNFEPAMGYEVYATKIITTGKDKLTLFEPYDKENKLPQLMRTKFQKILNDPRDMAHTWYYWEDRNMFVLYDEERNEPDAVVMRYVFLQEDAEDGTAAGV